MSIKAIIAWTTTLAACLALYRYFDSFAIFLASILPMVFTITHFRGIRSIVGRWGAIATLAFALAPIYVASIGPLWFISTKYTFVGSLPKPLEVASEYFYAPLYFYINNYITESQADFLTNDYLADWTRYGYWYFDVYSQMEEKLEASDMP